MGLGVHLELSNLDGRKDPQPDASEIQLGWPLETFEKY